jgi:uncharacterized membrane protein YeaQ/YmgE (transglycosylase-associated protein family)
MATIDINRATSTLTEASFLISIVLVVLGALIAQVMTEYLRNNVYDIPFRGGDAVYPVVAAMLVLVVAPARYSRPIALGASATSVRVALDQWNIV